MNYETKDYYQRIEDYELRCQAQSKKDLPFWKELVGHYQPARVLELACGSGRIGLALLDGQGSFLLDGLDIDEHMLAFYQDKLAHQPISIQQRVTLHQGDMSTYHLTHAGNYDLIFLAFNALGHLLETEQQINAFSRTYEHLTPGGRFVVDLYLPKDQGNETPSVPTRNKVIEIPGSKSYLQLSTIHAYDNHEQVASITTAIEKIFEDGSKEHYSTELKSHVFYPNELRLLFLFTGFKIEAIYGDYSWIPFAQGMRQIIIGRKDR